MCTCSINRPATNCLPPHVFLGVRTKHADKSMLNSKSHQVWYLGREKKQSSFFVAGKVWSSIAATLQPAKHSLHVFCARPKKVDTLFRNLDTLYLRSRRVLTSLMPRKQRDHLLLSFCLSSFAFVSNCPRVFTHSYLFRTPHTQSVSFLVWPVI